MMKLKQLLVGATLATAALATAPLLADTGHRHDRNATCSGQNCPAQSAQGGQGQHGGSHQGRMTQRGGQHGKHGGQGPHGMHGAQQGNAGAGCPMHEQPKST